MFALFQRSDVAPPHVRTCVGVALIRLLLSDMANSPTVTSVTSDNEFQTLRPEWASLFSRSRSACVFLTWEWMRTWWIHYRTDSDRLFILTIRIEGRLVGLLPLYIKTADEWRAFRVRTLRFLGTGECEADEVASEYLDLLCDPDVETVVVDVLQRYLGRCRDWDVMVLNDVLHDSAILKLLNGRPSFRYFGKSSVRTGVRYCVELPSSWNAYISALSGGAGKRLPYKRRKLERSAPIRMILVEREEELERAFDELTRLHTARWVSKGQAGVFGSARFAAFHRAMATILLQGGNLRFWLMLRGDQVVAALYNFHVDGTEYFYQGGFDVDVGVKYSLGTVAHLYAIEHAIATGDRRYDFMKGGLGSYKSEFCSVSIEMCEVHIYATTLRGIEAAWADWIVRSLRQVRDRFRTTWRDLAGRESSQVVFRNGRDSHVQ